jgi:glycosyltransferase involved in cell wall biosynthesis
MKVSIVTISFNQGRFLEEAICSVLDQRYPNVEYILVDAGSTDGSREIIETYRARLGAILFKPDRGPADGLNKGFGMATGDILGYINADDAYLPGAFEKVAAVFEKNPSIDVVYGHGYLIDENNRIIRRLYSDPFDLRRYIYGGVTVVQQSTFIRREAFRAVGGFNVHNRTCWDGELILDLALRGKKFKLINQFLACFRIHHTSISGSGRLNDQYIRDLGRLFWKARGREKSKLDKLYSQVVRLEKWLLNPVALKARLLDMISSGRTLRYP